MISGDGKVSAPRSGLVTINNVGPRERVDEEIRVRFGQIWQDESLLRNHCSKCNERVTGAMNF